MKTQENHEEFLDYNGSFYEYVARIFDSIFLSILWVIFSLPFITFGAATTAFYYTVIKVIRNDNGMVLIEFFNSFKTNFKKATLMWSIIASLIFLVQLNLGILLEYAKGTMGLVLLCFYLLLLLFLIGVAVYAFPALSRFEMSVGWILKVSVYMTVRYFLSTLILLLILITTMTLIYYIPILVFIIPTGVCLIYAYFMEKVLKKHTP